MIMIKLNDGVLLGVTRLNVERLTAGQPIHFILSRPITVTSIALAFGETKPDIVRQFEAAGVEVPQAVKDATDRDPL